MPRPETVLDLTPEQKRGTSALIIHWDKLPKRPHLLRPLAALLEATGQHPSTLEQVEEYGSTVIYTVKSLDEQIKKLEEVQGSWDSMESEYNRYIDGQLSPDFWTLPDVREWARKEGIYHALADVVGNE